MYKIEKCPYSIYSKNLRNILNIMNIIKSNLVLEGRRGVLSVTALADGRVVSDDGWTKRMWDVNSGSCVAVLGGIRHERHGLTLMEITMRDCPRPKVGLWTQRWRCATGHTLAVTAVEMISDGRVVSGSKDKTLRVWDKNKKKCLKKLTGHTGGVLAIAVLDDESVVSASWDNTLRVWNVNSGECLAVLKGHTHLVSVVTVLDDNHVVSGSWDNTLRVWDVDSAECLMVLEGNTCCVTAVGVLDDGRVVSGCVGGDLLVWDLCELLGWDTDIDTDIKGGLN